MYQWSFRKLTTNTGVTASISSCSCSSSSINQIQSRFFTNGSPLKKSYQPINKTSTTRTRPTIRFMNHQNIIYPIQYTSSTKNKINKFYTCQSSFSTSTANDEKDYETLPQNDTFRVEAGKNKKKYSPRRVWKAKSTESSNNNDNDNDDDYKHNIITNHENSDAEEYWNDSVTGRTTRSALGGLDEPDLSSMRDALETVGIQERQGGRMRQRRQGVLRECPQEDMRLLIENYTVPALASALRDREDILQLCASLLQENKLSELSDILKPYEQKYVNFRRQQETKLNITKGYNTSNLEVLRKGLNRMPRRVSQAHQRRAGVVLPLCNVNGVPCILFEKRSRHLRAHPDEVCLPGGMVCAANDRSIVATCLREMEEEIIGLEADKTTVLGVLRCNWGEVHHLVNVAVTPVVCFVGEIGNVTLEPNPDEVAECFTVPLALFLKQELWVHRQDFAPIFTGGPYMIWGLTGYIINRFVKDVLATYRVELPSEE